jgi:hypothetical protein
MSHGSDDCIQHNENIGPDQEGEGGFMRGGRAAAMLQSRPRSK